MHLGRLSTCAFVLPLLVTGVSSRTPVQQPKASKENTLDKPVEKLINGAFDLGLSSWKASPDVARKFSAESGVVLSASDESYVSQRVQGGLFLPSFGSNKTSSLPETLTLKGKSVGAPNAEVTVELLSAQSGTVLKSAKVLFSEIDSNQKVVWTNKDPVFATVLKIRSTSNAAKLSSVSLLGRESAAALDEAVRNTDFSHDLEGWTNSSKCMLINGSKAEGRYLTVYPEKSGNPWQEQLYKTLDVSVSEGHVVLINFSARSRTNSKLRVRYSLAEGDYAGEVEKEFQLTSEWKDYTLKVIASRSYPVGKSAVSFQFSYGRGVLELGKVGVYYM